MIAAGTHEFKPSRRREKRTNKAAKARGLWCRSPGWIISLDEARPPSSRALAVVVSDRYWVGDALKRSTLPTAHRRVGHDVVIEPINV
jgi:hypothetical protein